MNKDKNIIEKDKLSEHELMNRLDNEFDDCDFAISESATEGCVAVVFFYEEKL